MFASPWIHHAAHPDTSSLACLLAHERFKGLKDEDLAVALWKYTIDPVTGFYHFWSPADRDPERPWVAADYVKDPLKLINSYGYMLCGTVAAVFANLCEAGGLEARQVGVTGHCLNEVRYGGTWHLLDCDLRAIHRVRDGSRRIASLRELLADPTLVSDPVERSEPVYYVPDRPAAKVAEACYAPRVGNEMPRHVQHFHTMDFVLRPGERLTRHAAPVDGRWHFPPHWLEDAGKYAGEWSGAGPRERFPPHRTYFNGVFEYRPDLTTASRDFELGAWERENLVSTPSGLAVADGSKQRGWCVFLIHSPWVLAGRPTDPADASPEKKKNAVLVDLEIRVPEGQAGSVGLLCSPDGAHWHEVKRLRQSGRMHEDLSALFDRCHRGLLGLDVQGAAEVAAFSSAAWFCHAPNSFPRLAPGENTIRYHGGDERGGRTLTETWCAPLEPDEKAFAAALVASSNLKRGEKPANRLAPAEPGRPWQAVFRARPAALTGRPVLRARCWTSIATVKGDPGQPPTAYEDQPPRVVLEAACAKEGPWTRVADSVVPIHKDGWHFSLDGQFELPGRGAPEIFVRVTSDMPGSEVRVALACALPEASTAAPPLESIHRWREDGKPCEHREVIARPDGACSYLVQAGPGTIENEAVMLQAPSALPSRH